MTISLEQSDTYNELVAELRRNARAIRDQTHRAGFECKCPDLLSWKAADAIERLLQCQSSQ